MATPMRRLSESNLVRFTYELGARVRSGLSGSDAMEDLARTSRSADVRGVACTLRDTMREGASLAQAFERYPEVFASPFASVVGAAETAGRLGLALEDLAAFVARARETRWQIVRAMTWPGGIFAAAVLLLIAALIFLFPRFVSSFMSTGADLPLPTLILLGATEVFKQYTSQCCAVMLGILVMYVALQKIRAGRRLVDSAKLRLPMFGPILENIVISGFFENFSMMLAAGLQVDSALGVCERLMGNTILAARVADARTSVENGVPLSAAMSRAGFVPSHIRRMLEMGELSGDMLGAIDKTRNHYEKEIPKGIRRTIFVLEPLALIMITVVLVSLCDASTFPVYKTVSYIMR